MTGSINVPKMLLVAREAVWTTGSVVARAPEDHDSVTAEYSVSDQRYTVQTSFVGPPNTPKGSIHIGSTVEIVYARSAPDLAALEDPEAALRNELASVALAAILGGSAFAYAFARRARKAG